jgi:hypothetical protein
MDWNDVELRVFSTDDASVAGLFALPKDSLRTINLSSSNGRSALAEDPLRGKVRWRITRFEKLSSHRTESHGSL